MTLTESFLSRLICVAMAFVFAVGLIHLGVKLREIQVQEAADYNYASSRQAIRRVQIGGRRGRIFDRQGIVLADNRQSLSIVCNPAYYQKRTWKSSVEAIAVAISNVATVVGLPVTLSETVIRRHIAQTLAMPLFVWRDVDDEAVARFSENERECGGFSVMATEERVYPQKTLAAHLIGYVGHDRGSSEAGDEKYNYYLPELRGRSGLEHYYDGFLGGVPGERKLVVDARGFAIREWTVTSPQPGPDLQLTLNVRIQREAERVLSGERGACVVLDPRNGDVLALASAPGFDPNDFIPVLHHELYDRYVADPGKPLLNRATGGAYAPGSTFKPITALAGMSVGFPEQMSYCCNGVFVLGSMHLRCARRWGHGSLDLRHAIMVSCNPFFCNLGMECGTNALLRTAKTFGLGQKTGIDLGVDMAGTVPDGEWKMRMYREHWFQGDLAQMSIGQGMLLVSPLQMAMVAGAIGTGYLVVPHLKADIETRRSPLPIPEAHLKVVREGMRMVVAGDGEQDGSGKHGGEGVPVPVAGKTGTAEIGRGENRRKNTWFIAYAPAEKPVVSVALIIENGQSGGGTAAPRVASVLKEVFGVL